MRSKAETVEDYLESLPEERRLPMLALRSAIRKRLPKGFRETMGYGMMGWVVPHATYPAGYHTDPKQPLPFIGLASQKQYIALYHMGLYADAKLLKWFKEAYAESGAGKLDMGKSCIRFKKPEKIPFKLIGELAGKVTVKEWIAAYEKNLKR